MGMAVGGIAQHTKKAGVPLICIAGALGEDVADAYHSGVTVAFSINRESLPFDEAAGKTRENLSRTTENILRL